MLGLVDRIEGGKLDFLLVFSLLLTGFLFFLLIFQRNELLPNIDGPYYLIQVRSLLEGRGLVYGDPPLALYLLALFAYITGGVSSGVKIGVSFLCSMVIIPAYFLMKRLGRGYLPGVVAMLLVVFSAPFIRMMTDFMKNAIGICWLLSFIYFLHDLSSPNHSRGSIALASLFLLLTGLTHVLVFGVAFLYLMIFLILAIIRGEERRFIIKASAIMFLTVAAFVLVASIFFSPLFTDFGKFFSFMDDLGGSQENPQRAAIFAAPGRVPAPRPQRPPGDSHDPFSLPVIGGWGVVVSVIGLGTAISLVEWRRGERRDMIIPATTVVSFILFFPYLPGQWLSRFLLMIVVPTSIILSYTVSGEWLSGEKGLNAPDFKSFTPLLAVVCIIFFAVQALIFSLSVSPTIEEEAHSDLVEMGEIVPEGSLIIVPKRHGLGYWVEYLVGEEVLGQGEELSPLLWESYQKVLAIFYRHQVPGWAADVVYSGDELILVELEGSEFKGKGQPGALW